MPSAAAAADQRVASGYVTAKPAISQPAGALAEGMDGTRVPLNEEGQEAVLVILEHDCAPSELGAVRPDAGSRVWSGEGDL